MFKKRLPPLEPLIAFEAAARLLSFTRAGEELHLSQAAISQQIRSLEGSLQVQLFTRSHRAVQLTNEGREYQHTVVAILKQLAGATMDIQNIEFSQQLVIGCDQCFATQWLSPRFAQLRQLLPAVGLRIIASDDYDESLGPEIQTAVLHGDAQWSGFHAQLLCAEEVYPICSPDYPHQQAQQDWAGWLLQAQLIDLVDSHWNWMNWRLWLGGNNIDEPLGNRNLHINSYPLVIDAACAGLGVALGWGGLVDDLIAQGRLIRPLTQSSKTEFGYYFLCRENLQDDETIVLLRNWLFQEFATTRAGV
ncbi:MAG: LysR family transcriptional regulator [Gammaproteobacteria bacterium]|nr:LysR family transcriptional regulator [Gammaproteobacteria bacterium]